MTNVKRLVIIILLLLILMISHQMHKTKRTDHFQYSVSGDMTVEECSQSIDELYNLIASLKAANFPVELRQAYAMTVLTKDPKHANHVRELIDKMDMSDADKRQLNNLVFKNKGLIYSLKDKQAMVTANNIFEKLNSYENDMLYHSISDN